MSLSFLKMVRSNPRPGDFIWDSLALGDPIWSYFGRWSFNETMVKDDENHGEWMWMVPSSMVFGCFWYFISNVLKEHQTMLAGTKELLGIFLGSLRRQKCCQGTPLWLPSCTTCPTSRSPVRVLWLRAGEDGKRCLSQSWTNEPKWKSWKLGKSTSYRWSFPFMAIWCREFQFPRLIRGSYP